MRQTESGLGRLVRSVVEPMGYELVGTQLLQRGKGGAVLRVYIDHLDEGSGKAITLDDCGAVSHQLSGVLDVEDPIAGHYDLEVSSPGLDRPLFTGAHFERFCGSRARLRLVEKVAGRRKLEGVIAGLEGETVLLETDGETWEIPLDRVESARLVPEF